MKKTVLFSAVLVIALIVSANIVFAADSNVIAPLNNGGMESPIENTTQAYSLLVTIVRWVYTIFFVIAVLFILIAAYNFILGGKDETKVKLAKVQLKYAIIAIAIALVSAGASTIVQNVLEDRQTSPAQPGGTGHKSESEIESRTGGLKLFFKRQSGSIEAQSINKKGRPKYTSI